jgi:general secretion pathway protein D
VFATRRAGFSGKARAAVVLTLVWVLPGCVQDSASGPVRSDPLSGIRGTDLAARQPRPVDSESGITQQSSRPLLFPGTELASPAPGDIETQKPANLYSPASTGAATLRDGVQINFEDADVAVVARTLVGDVLGMSYVIDPRVTGTVTLRSTAPVPRKDVLSVFESVLRMANAAAVREGSLVKIVPLNEAGGSGSVSAGAGQAGFGVSVVPLRYTSAATVARVAENFLSRPGAIRVDAARNLLLLQGTGAERRAAVEVVSSFDVEWLRNQSVGIYPLKSTSPESMIAELERVFESSEGGQGQGMIRFQPVQRMNAVMAVAKNPQFLERATQWVQRLDRSDTSGTTLRVYRVKYGNAPKVAAILNDIFVRSGGGGGSAIDNLAPGSRSSQGRLDTAGGGASERGGGAAPGQGGAPAAAGGAGAAGGGAGGAGGAGGGNRGAGTIPASFDTFSDRKSSSGDPFGFGAPSGGGGGGNAIFQNVRITADNSNNSVVIYSNQEDYRVIERALQEIDRPKLQVAIDATIAEVTLGEGLDYGVRFFFSSKSVGAGNDKGSLGVLDASSVISRVLPGFNLLLGSEKQPRVVLDALASVTDVKVLSSPSLVVMDNQPAVLQVGDEIPVSTRSATLIEAPGAPIVNSIEFRNTGVILKVLPHVHANGAIDLEVEQEISNANSTEPTLTPTISQRRIKSMISVMSGQTVLLGGLISEREENSKSGIPGLRSIKFLGDLFGKTSGSKHRTELIIFIRPQLIRNALDASVVAEEFRDRLGSMRSPIVNGAELHGGPVSRKY